MSVYNVGKVVAAVIENEGLVLCVERRKDMALKARQTSARNTLFRKYLLSKFLVDI